ncbi:hypothetical protein ACO22_08024, partial [Paracoccidioides brasiliensis]
CENKSYVVKRLTPDVFKQSLQLKNEFADTHRLPMHIDYNKEEHTLVYEYFRNDLLSLVKDNPNFPLAARKQILWEAGKALKKLHARNWIHGRVSIDRMALADLDYGLKVKDSQFLRLPGAQRIGNPTWRSPEAQTGKGIHKKSGVLLWGVDSVAAEEHLLITTILLPLYNHGVGDSARGFPGAKGIRFHARIGRFDQNARVRWSTSARTPDANQS